MLKAVKKTLKEENITSVGEISLILINDREIKRLNRRFRKVNRITDVISFLYTASPLSGDIFIAKQRSKLQAKEQKHSWRKELAYLAIHGVLHLRGYTDYTRGARARMFNRQDKIFKMLQP